MVLALLTAALCLSAAQPKPDSAALRPGGLEMNFTAVMQVEEPGKASDRLVARTEAMGGFFSRRSQEGLELRLPMAKADAWIDSLPETGLVVERNLQTQSLEGEWVEQTSRLKAKKASLNDYYAMLKVSGDSTIFTIQNAITQLQSEIEQSMQEVLKLEDRMHFARITINFRFPDRTAPLASGTSHFQWLNRLDLGQLLERFHYAED